EVTAEFDVLVVAEARVAVDAHPPGIHRFGDLADLVPAERPGQIEPGAFGAEARQNRFDFQRHHALRRFISMLSITYGTLALQGRAFAMRHEDVLLVVRAVGESDDALVGARAAFAHGHHFGLDPQRVADEYGRREADLVPAEIGDRRSLREIGRAHV